MVNSQKIIDTLSSDTSNGMARARACRPDDEPARNTMTALVSYRSSGQILVIADNEEALTRAQSLSPSLHHTLLLNRAGDQPRVEAFGLCSPGKIKPKVSSEKILCSQVAAVTGYLGHFDALLSVQDTRIGLAEQVFQGQGHFDLVLDLCTPPHLQQDVLPPGYYASDDDPASLQSVLDEMSGLVGEFEKPRYFDFDPDVCAHGRSGIQGCTRCLDVCPTKAISSRGNAVELDPYLCQGGGSCAAACPTGAIRYVYPDMPYVLNRIRKRLHEYRLAGGDRACLLFYAADDTDTLLSCAAQLPDFVFPVEVEELGALGMEAWFMALAYGASHILMWSESTLAPSVMGQSQTQLDLATTLMEAMGYSRDRLQLLDATGCESLLDKLQALPQQPDTVPASFSVFEDKQTNLRLALDHLHRQAPQPRPFVSLPAGAPFGEVWVDQQSCTLCMACVAQCPGSALLAGETLPQLKFIEDRCIQCGLCARSCPEDAIGPSPRYMFEAARRLAPRVLNEEQPFNCILCGKPFATRKMVDKMAGKLSQHWMFKGKQDALRRLQMCEDCRVRDLYEHESDIDVHTRSRS